MVSGEAVTVGAFATLFDPASSRLDFEIRYSVYTDESTDTDMPDVVARIVGDELTLTPVGAPGDSRTYARAE